MPDPLFRNISADDPDVQQAHALAASTIGQFIKLVQTARADAFMAKLSFRDPGLSERLGEERLFYLWLSEIVFHPEQNLLSGTFFEVPEAIERWHRVGERLAFDRESVFDWMAIDRGRMTGGFTIRLTRSRLASQEEKAAYDQYIGVDEYEPL